MASIHKEIFIDARPDDVWAAVRDVGALHHRLVPGFVVDTRLEGDARIVTFGDGLVVREVIVDIDDKARRLVYAVDSERFTHYNASVEIIGDDGERHSRVVWTIDLLPNELADYIGGRMTQAASIMKQTLER